MRRLCSETLKNYAASRGVSVDIPSYDRGALKPGHVHLGFGNFFPAFAAYKTHQLLQAGNKQAFDYGIVGVNINRTDKSDRLNQQDGLYTVLELDKAGVNRLTVVGSLIKFLFAPKDPEAIYALLAAPETRIVSLTILPQTYQSYRDAQGNLDVSHPDIQNDLVAGNVPKTVLGYLLRGLQRRERKGLPGFTVMSLDNLADNGELVRLLCRQFAEAFDPSLLSVVDAKIGFPNSMVDRIVPKTTPELLEAVSGPLGLEDVAAIPAEPMPAVSWVLEGGKFVNGRPAWEELGLAHVVPDASPYELMKLRLINGSFFSACQLGDLKGIQFVHEAVEDPFIRRFVVELMERESGPTLNPVPGVDMDSYKMEIIERLSNAALRDTVARVVKDGALTNSLNAARDQVRLGLPIDLRALSIAAWMRRCRVELNEAGGKIDFAYPSADLLRAKAKEGGNDPRPLLSVASVFGDLGGCQPFVDAIAKYLSLLDQPNGVNVAIEAAVGGGH